MAKTKIQASNLYKGRFGIMWFLLFKILAFSSNASALRLQIGHSDDATEGHVPIVPMGQPDVQIFTEYFKLRVNTTRDLPTEPMMGRTDIRIFSKYLTNATSYLEWGSGGSTVFASKFENIKHMRTLENDLSWVEALKKSEPIKRAIDSGKLDLVYIDTGAITPAGYPVDDSTFDLWPRYSDGADSSNYDLILVDGRYRVGCFLKALQRFPKTVTIMIHDYSRPAFHIVERFADIVDKGNELVVFKPKIDVDAKELDATIKKYEHVPGP